MTHGPELQMEPFLWFLYIVKELRCHIKKDADTYWTFKFSL